MRVVETPEQLSAFRAGARAALHLERLAPGMAALVDLAIGVGKSWLLDDIVEHLAVEGDTLVIVLEPTRALITERRGIRLPPAGVPVAHLRPRPADRCGALDREWQALERRGMATLGRIRLCCACPRLQGCFWPTQQQKSRLHGVRILYATQAHLHLDAGFVNRMQQRTGATSVVVLIDEADVLVASARRRISHDDLVRLRELLADPNLSPTRINQRMLAFLDLLLEADSEALRSGGWRVPRTQPRWEAGMQQRGTRRYGRSFRWVLGELRTLVRSGPESRQRLANGDLTYAHTPRLADAVTVIFSATAEPAILRQRLGINDLAVPFATVAFRHPGTQVYNIASNVGALNWFDRNHPQILYAFAQLITQRLRAGKRVLVVTKKEVEDRVANRLTAEMQQLGLPEARAGCWAAEAVPRLTDPWFVPLIHYGCIGINDFEHFDCCYCVTSYNVTPAVLDAAIQEHYAPELRLPIEIAVAGQPRRRRAFVRDRRHADIDVAQLANTALRQQEMGVVIQAVGRVRPFTNAREIITMQCGEHPKMPYSREFPTLAAFRQHFGLETRRASQSEANRIAVLTAKAQGLTQQAVASATGLGLRTVKRYWHDAVVAQREAV